MRVVGLVLLAMGWWPLSAEAGAQPHMIFGSVGIVGGQTARLNISNIGTPDFAPACVIELGFVGGDNQALVPAVRVTLGGSRSTQVHISNRDLPAGQSQVRAFVGVAPGFPPGPCRSLVGNVEVVDDATGATSLHVQPLVYSGFNPQPEPPALGGIGGR
jgi:hypothetical protein